jgi:hypothetical protein
MADYEKYGCIFFVVWAVVAALVILAWSQGWLPFP